MCVQSIWDSRRCVVVKTRLLNVTCCSDMFTREADTLSIDVRSVSVGEITGDKR
jgi:hypothetical protein